MERNHLAVYELERHAVTVDARDAVYVVAGHGPPLMFLHGWGVSHTAYTRALAQLVTRGRRVYAPALPGFGGTAELPDAELTLAGYARWVDRFMTAVGIAEPVTLIGHSFGGGVAIQSAHDWPHRVVRLILINSIGGSAWSHQQGLVRLLRDRPPWDWGLHPQTDLLPVRQLTRVIPLIVADAVPNVLRSPRAILRVAHLARTADLTTQLEELKRRRLPVVVVWGERDKVLPSTALGQLCTALGDPQLITVPGSHTWLPADPNGFGEVMTNVIGATAATADSADQVDS